MITKMDIANLCDCAQSAIAAAKRYGEIEGADVKGWQWTEAKRDYDDSKQSLKDAAELLKARATN